MAVGKIGPFDLVKDNWDIYVDRLEQYFIANTVKDEVKVATLITVIGNDAYELMVSVCTPDKPASKSYAELVSLMKAHLNPKPSILAERFKFRQRIQKREEAIATFVTELKKLSKDCGFTAHSLKENLRDQFVCGLVSDDIRQKLFTEDDSITFDRAYRLAVSMEAAEANAALVEDCTRGSSTSTGSAAPAQAVYRVDVERGRRQRGPGRPRAAPRDSAPGAGGGPSAERGAGGGKRQQTGYRGPSDNYSNHGSECNVCGGKHSAEKCKFRYYVCRVCNQQGHLKKMCPNNQKNQSLHAIQENIDGGFVSRNDSDISDEVIIDINRLSIGQCKPIHINLNIDGHDIDMECDTGSAVSCISDRLYKKMFSNSRIEPCKLMLRYYTGEIVRPVGVIRPIVKYKDKRKQLDLYVIKNGKTVLLGRQWLAELKISVSALEYSLNNTSALANEKFNWKEFSSRYSDVLAEGLGRFTGGPVSLHVREGARPAFLRARPLAYALREPVERALEQLVRDDILEPVERSDWATPIVPVVKKDGSIRICADFKVTLNKYLEVDRYPLPKMEDLLTRLHGGERFSKIDLSQAYAQFELDDSRKYTVINTHKGLFMYKRLVYGLASSPGIFQRRLEQLFADLPSVGVFLDDIIITGRDTTHHLENLHKVFQRLQSSGLRVKKEKCSFFEESIDYLGHVISKKGVHTCSEKIKAIDNTPVPENITELRAFIGMVMYYGKFIKNVSTILSPLYKLLRAGVSFVWSGECQAAFERVKGALRSSEVLVHYSPELPLVLTADASSAGVGAVISHLTPDGERPIAYASRTLTTAERAYAQIDREALAIVYGVRKFHQYLYGRKFLLRTDHKPLTYIFGNKVGIPVMAASRLQRWAILLSGYTYDIEYVTSARNCADALSRLPQPTEKAECSSSEVTYLNFAENFLPIMNNDVQEATARDIILAKVMYYAQSGWPASCPNDELKPYFVRRNEIYIDRGCIMWGYRIVIPISLQGNILKQLHSSHMGIVKTKSLARSYVWWPQIDADVESTCRRCETCALEAPAPPRAAPQPWPYIAQPWSRLHVDFLGPFHGRTFLVVIDSSTKWIEIFEMIKTNATALIKILRSLFARFGLPLEIVSDQGPPFTSSEMKNFLVNNGIKQSFSPVYHPASNGAAENAVKLCKRAIKKAIRDSVDIDTALQTYLLAYRNTKHSTTGESPAMLLQRRSLRSRLDLLRSDRALLDRVGEAQRRQAASAGAAPGARAVHGDVWARGYGGQDKWVRGTVVQNEGSRRYLVQSDSGRLLTRHVDQIRSRSRRSSLMYPPTESEGCEAVDTQQPPVVSEAEVGGASPGKAREKDASISNRVEEEVSVQPPMQPPPPPPRVDPAPPVPRHSVRTRKPPTRFGFEID